ncbi:MAG: ComEC family competence protein, partial [Marinobacter sp.]|nr:ComEC family competence protein [Marinobacter sp.]
AHAEGQELSVSGYLCDVPSTGSFNSLRFSFCVTRWHNLSADAEGARLPDLLRLSWYGHAGEALPGSRLRLDVVLKRPHGTLNPYGFRYENWLFRKGYRATGSVRGVQPAPAVECSLHCQYRQLHLSLKNWVEERFGNTEHFALISSLLIGHRGAMTQQHWDVLKATGTIHLIAISGLHLGLVALGAGFLCRRLLLAMPARRLSERQARLIVFLVVLACCLVYALAAGFTVPTRRALIMVIVAGWMLLLARQSPVWLPFLTALAVVLLLDPFAPLDQGFWLSFTAVAVLIAVFSARLAGAGWLGSLLVAQVSVFAGLWPVLEVFGQGQPLAGLLANLIAIPWVSL